MTENDAAANLTSALHQVLSHQEEVERAKEEERTAASRLNSCECARANAASALAKAIAALPEPILREVFTELDRLVPIADRPMVFVVKHEPKATRVDQ